MSVVPIISVTGTKGKTTTVAVIASVLHALEHNVLKVDTTGHFINDERRSTLQQSKDIWGLVPSVAPGRYLWEFLTNPELRRDGVAVLECSLGCSSLKGLGYHYHNVGVFLNVFEDHLGSSKRLQVKADIAKAKSFVFSRLTNEGSYAVFNADDELVVETLHASLPEGADNIKILPFGVTFEHFDLASHLGSGGSAITRSGDYIVLKRADQDDVVMADLTRIPWTFDGKFEPSVWNLMAAAAAIYAHRNGEWTEVVRAAFEAVRLDPYGGRLTLLENDKGVTVLADYAHEKISLGLVAELARTQVKAGGKVIGVVRLAYDRTDELLQETSQIIAKVFDEVIIYDKIDGHWRKAKLPTKANTRFPQIEGRTSQVMYDAMRPVNSQVTRILREDEALAYAAAQAQPGDVVVAIVNDDIERSIEFIKESFKAEFV